MVKIRPATSGDVNTILNVHRLAVRGIAADFYDKKIIEDWAPLPIQSEQISDLAKRIESGEEKVFVAENEKGKTIGFGSIVPSQSELRAVYVSPKIGRKGVGGSILKRLEEFAINQGISELHMDASINAEAFYLSHGFIVVERGEHTLKSGRKMACVKMKKSLVQANPTP